MEAEMQSDGATSQGMTAATKSWKMQGMGSSLEPPEGAWLYQHFDLGSVKLI